MKSILELNEIEGKKFFLKQESYVNFDLPIYFSFQTILDKIDKKLSGKKLSDFRVSSPRDFDGVNYHLITNKDGKYAWRPFQLIHPAIYVSLVHHITEKNNWKIIKNRFKIFQENKKIECHSLPMVSDNERKTDKEAQILTWWQEIEQKSILFTLDYQYILHTDITDCYSSIYTHSISWALHTKIEAKKKENRKKQSLIGVAIDTHLQDMDFGQTNGIPQGSVVMDFIAEIELGYIDILLSEKLDELKITEYHILRYRDDYRIFTNNPFEAEQITKTLSEILSDLGLKLNADKTVASDNIIKSAIKADKRYWIENKRITENIQKWLIQLYLLSEKFPNSGTLDTQMRELLKFLEKNKRQYQNIEVLISLVTEIAFRNPRVSQTAILILSILLNQIKEKVERKEIVQKIHDKFKQIPNSSLSIVWLQRLFLKIDKGIEYDEPICKRVLDNNEEIWNSKWLNNSLKEIIDKTPIITNEIVKKLRVKVSKKEMNKIVRKRIYDYG